MKVSYNFYCKDNKHIWGCFTHWFLHDGGYIHNANKTHVVAVLNTIHNN